MDDDATRFTWRIVLIVFIALVAILYITMSQYKHPDPLKDCSRPDLYPICDRATTPQALPPASSTMQYLSIIATIALAILLIYISYHASVIEQANLVTGASEASQTGSPAKLEEK